MKAKVRETGEIINVEPMWDRDEYMVGYVNRDTHITYSVWELEFDYLSIPPRSNIDWEQRRYEIAKSMLSHAPYYYCKEAINYAIEQADKLIKRLKGETK